MKFQLRADCRIRHEVVDTNIVFIAIDQKSLDFFDGEGVGWPWPRSFYAKVLDYLEGAGSKAVIFDIDFSSKVNVIETESDYENKVFATSLKKSKNVFLIGIGENVKNVKSPENENINEMSKTKSCSRLKSFDNIILPQKVLISKGIGIGLVNLFPDYDGVLRNYYLLYKVKNRYMPNISYAVYSKLYKKSPVFKCGNDGLMINWYGRGGTGGQYRYFSFASVLLSQIKKENNVKVIVPENVFKNKIVFIGGTAPTLLDYKNTPVSGVSKFPAMEIHGVILNNLIKNDFLYKVNSFVEIIFSLLLIFVVYLIINKYRNGFVSASLSTAVILFFVFINYLLFLNNIVLDISYSIFSAFLAQISFLSYNYFVIDKDKRELRKLFSKYVSSDVIDDLINNSKTVELNGKEIFATAFFSDIKNFTTISEQTTPKKLVEFLNNYFNIVGNTLLSNNAMLDKFIGDGIMAIFGAPIQKEEHAKFACKAAIEIQRLIKNSNTKENVNWGMTTRIGINSGKMVVGNIGTKQRMDYTAIGDAVNIAARLESLNKLYGTDVLVSETTYSLTKDDFLFREIDLIAVKGKSIPIKIYQLITDEYDTKFIKMIKVFERGIYLYRDKKWDNAVLLFQQFLNEYPNDIASKLYIERCKKNSTMDIPEFWDGVYYATTK